MGLSHSQQSVKAGSSSQAAAAANSDSTLSGGIPRPHRQVLIAVDGSANSLKAFDFWSRVPGSENDSIIFINALEMPNALTGLLLSPSGTFDYDEYEKQSSTMWARTEQLRKSMLANCERKGMKCRFITECGSPGAAIVDAAKGLGVNVVVLGSRGNNGIRKTILGSVSDYVLQHSCRPVVVVPKDS